MSIIISQVLIPLSYRIMILYSDIVLCIDFLRVYCFRVRVRVRVRVRIRILVFQYSYSRIRLLPYVPSCGCLLCVVLLLMSPILVSVEPSCVVIPSCRFYSYIPLPSFLLHSSRCPDFPTDYIYSYKFAVTSFILIDIAWRRRRRCFINTIMMTTMTNQRSCKLTFVASQNFTMLVKIESSIPPLLIILIKTKPYQTWYAQLHVGVVATNRRECKRNYIIRQFGLRDFPPLLLSLYLYCCCVSCFVKLIIFYVCWYGVFVPAINR